MCGKDCIWPLIWALLLWLPATAQAWQGRCVGVVDGDTVDVMHEGRAERIRLASIDAPEKRQPFGQVAKRALSDLVFQQEVEVEPAGSDRYGRTLATIKINGRSVQAELLTSGMVWVYRKYSSDAELIAIEQQARSAKRGLWSDPSPIPPWEWRKSR